MNAEQQRLEEHRRGENDWRLWGPYLSDRAWGTVREDYSAGGDAWDYFSHYHSHSRAYRWSEDGIAGICDEKQRLCLAVALWNGVDPALKERPFGLTNGQGNRGEDVKDYWFHLDALPSHAYLKTLYKYPQARFPYEQLVEENARRNRNEAPFQLLDTGVFDEQRYFDVFVEYAKKSTTCLHMRITVCNRGPEAAPLHVLPTLWFRNTWSWGERVGVKPIVTDAHKGGAAWAVRAAHPELGEYHLYGRDEAETLFTENETNNKRLFDAPNDSLYVKDAFHRYVVQGDKDAVNPDRHGSKFAAAVSMTLAPGEERTLDLMLSNGPTTKPFADFGAVLADRKSEADIFFNHLLPKADDEDALIFRQAVAGMIWSKQFFHYDVSRWLDGDQLKPPAERIRGRNANWLHLKAEDVISMPDGWEYPWFAAWDLAYQCVVFSMFDIDFAKEQLELLLENRYLHPNGQIPAYEWSFEDVNPPVHATVVLEVFRRERKIRGQGDYAYLRRVFNKLVMNYGWWLNRKDVQGHNIFEGGFMGLDNISVYDRSKLPDGYSLKQADATGWMAMFCLNMTAIAVELAQEDSEYEDMAMMTYAQFLAIADAVDGSRYSTVSLWDEDASFFKDLLVHPGGGNTHIDVYSYVGLIPLFAGELTIPEQLDNLPRFKEMLDRHAGGSYDGRVVAACPVHANEKGEHFLALVDSDRFKLILTRLLDEDQFLSPYGIRGVSRTHAQHQHHDALGMDGAAFRYEPGESQSPLFGGNSNWRGPVWMPINYTLLRALSKYARYLGDEDTVKLPGSENKEVSVLEAVDMIADRLIAVFRRGDDGIVPAFEPKSPFQSDPHWRDLRLFYEYFHGETGRGLGASHQTGWTGLTANLIKRKYLRQSSL